MKCKIIKSIQPNKVSSQVPPLYRNKINIIDIGTSLVTILLFPHNRRDVVISRHVSKALAKVSDSSEKLVAVGANFTDESINLLINRNVEVISLGDFYWTDKSYEQAKRPPKTN